MCILPVLSGPDDAGKNARAAASVAALPGSYVKPVVLSLSILLQATQKAPGRPRLHANCQPGPWSSLL
jgi:hypothetical protein